MKIKWFQNSKIRQMILSQLIVMSFYSYSQDIPNKSTNEDPHWSDLVVMSSRYMGPNALPVPDIRTGKINSHWELTTGFDYQFFKYDKTVDFFAKMNIPLVKNIVSLEFYGVVVEYFKMDTILKQERNTFDYEWKNYAFGDLNFATIIQLLKDHDKLPDISLRLNCRTASGTNLRAARYTDMPGYFFDLSFGKKIELKEKVIKNINIYSMLGFYVWQTNSVKHRQNDAFLYGIGADINFSKIELSNSFGGYIGYIGNGDKPMVYRIHVMYKTKNIYYKIGWQAGINDVLYNSFTLSLVFNFDKKK